MGHPITLPKHYLEFILFYLEYGVDKNSLQKDKSQSLLFDKTGDTMITHQTAQDMIYLCSCAINEKIPDQHRIHEMNLKELYCAAKFHMLTAIVAVALESAGIKSKTFMQAKANAIRKNALLETEKNAITACFENEGIWYLMLKGSVLKELYPKEWMRQMTDVDILFDEKYRDRVKEIMGSLGFTTSSFGKDGHHDCYQKPPVSDFEMHHSLFDALSFEDITEKSVDITEYYENINNKLLSCNQGKNSRKLSDEDFYLLLIAHDYKHYANAGVGIRSLLDLYIYKRKFSDKMDIEYLDKELKTLGMAEFEQKNRELAFALFDGKQLTHEQSEMFEYMLFSGVHGTYDNLLKNRIKRFGGGRKAKLMYCLSRLFPSMVYIKVKYPFVYKHKMLIPLLPVYRMGKGLLFYSKHLIQEICELTKH